MTVRLRPHHLLCVLTYVGKGYSPAFTANLTAIAERLAAGEAIEIVEGPDDVCAPLLDDPDPHCRRRRVSDRDRAAAGEIGGLLARPIAAGTRMTLGERRVRQLRAAFSEGRIRRACGGCEWQDLCGAVAAGGFAEVTLTARRARSPRTGR